MSPQIETALVTGGFVLVSALLTLIVTQWANFRLQTGQRQERREERRADYREWYRRTLFEKRLAAAHAAHAWLFRLNVAVSNADFGNPESEANQSLRRVVMDAREWYDNNALYLYDDLPKSSEFVGLINSAASFANGGIPGRGVGGFWNFFVSVDGAVRDRARKLLEVESARRDSDGK